MNPAPPSASKGRLIGGIASSLLYSSWLVLLLATLLDPSASFQAIRRLLLIFLIAFVPLGLAMFSSLAREAFWACVYFIFMLFLGDFAAELLGGLMALTGRSRLHPIGIVTVLIAIVVIVQARKIRAVRAPAMAGTLAGLFAFPLFQLLFAVHEVWAGFNSPYLGPDDPSSSLFLVVRLFAGLMLMIFMWPRRDASPSLGLPVDLNRYPKLKESLHRISQLTGQSAPEKVYLNSEVNFGFVKEGSWFGFGGKSALQLGAPALAVLSRESVGCLLAHEYGHSRLGHWSIHSRAYLGLQSLEYLDGMNQAGRPFVRFFVENGIGWYVMAIWRSLLRGLMIPLRRDFELEADHFAADKVGSSAMVSALRDVAATKMCFDAFKAEGDSTPGRNTLEEFIEYWQSPQGEARCRLQLSARENVKTRSGDRYPSLGDRIRALESLDLPARAVPFDAVPAFKLFGDSIAELDDIYSRLPRTQIHRPTEINTSSSTNLSPELAPALAAVQGGSKVRTRIATRSRSPRPPIGQMLLVVMTAVALVSIGIGIFVWRDSERELLAEKATQWELHIPIFFAIGNSPPQSLFFARIPSGHSEPTVSTETLSDGEKVETTTYLYGNGAYFDEIQIEEVQVSRPDSGDASSRRAEIISELMKPYAVSYVADVHEIEIRFKEYQVTDPESDNKEEGTEAGPYESILTFDTPDSVGLVFLKSHRNDAGNGILDFANHFHL